MLHLANTHCYYSTCAAKQIAITFTSWKQRHCFHEATKSFFLFFFYPWMDRCVPSVVLTFPNQLCQSFCNKMWRQFINVHNPSSETLNPHQVFWLWPFYFWLDFIIFALFVMNTSHKWVNQVKKIKLETFLKMTPNTVVLL